MKNGATDRASHKKNYNLTDVQNALAPFEEVLLANLPNKEQVLEHARLRKLKKEMRNSALMLCVTFVAATYWFDPVYKTQALTTHQGEIQQVQLSDGSQLQLNSNTQLVVSYALRSRRFYLKQGEATFNVKHFTQSWMRPLERRFTVYSDQLKVQDIGTVFTVRRYEVDHHSVMVSQGQVRVSLLSQPDLKPLDVYQQQQIVHQGQQLFYSPEPDIEALLAWHSGYLQCDAMPLSQVISELRRYQPLVVHFKDKSSANTLISGRFKLDHAEQLMQLLPQISKVEVVQNQLGQWLIASKAQMK